MRILGLGIGTYLSECEYSDINLTDLPTIFDYDMVIMDLRQMSATYNKHIAKKLNEFRKFFQTGGICYVIMQKFDKDNTVSNYDWCPFSKEIEIVNKSGKTVSCQSKDAKPIFDSTVFEWICFFSKYPEDTIILATNRANDPISIMVPCENGHCVFLPNPDDTTKLGNTIIGKGLNIIPAEREEVAISTQLPSWATDFMTETELNLLKARNKIVEKLGKYNKFKPLLWETGDSLQELVIDAFEELGIEVSRLPKESHGDFEFPIKEDLTGVSEVKGLSGNGDRRNLRQLLDYFVEQRDIEKRDVKGVFIVNHFRNEKPSERGNPVTQDALELVNTYNFHTLTTTQLYDCLIKFWENKLTKEDFLRRFQ